MRLLAATRATGQAANSTLHRWQVGIKLVLRVARSSGSILRLTVDGLGSLRLASQPSLPPGAPTKAVGSVTSASITVMSPSPENWMICRPPALRIEKVRDVWKFLWFVQTSCCLKVRVDHWLWKLQICWGTQPVKDSCTSSTSFSRLEVRVIKNDGSLRSCRKYWKKKTLRYPMSEKNSHIGNWEIRSHMSHCNLNPPWILTLPTPSKTRVE